MGFFLGEEEGDNLRQLVASEALDLCPCGARASRPLVNLASSLVFENTTIAMKLMPVMGVRVYPDLGGGV